MEATAATMGTCRSEVGAMCVVMTADEYAALQKRVRAAQPTRCPACGSSRIAPLFLDEQDCSWDCENCGAVFTPEAMP